MTSFETRMGGSQEAFPETVWSSILSCTDANSAQRKAGLNHLFALYWRPVYKFVRAAGGRTVEDAKDLTQEFFCHILEGELISRYDRDQGRFRNFLKGALRNFLAEARRDGSRQKRGGGIVSVSLNVEEVENDRFLADRNRLSPEELFDRQWARDVMAQSLVRLRAALNGEGKADYFKVYEMYELHPGEADRPTYEQVARRLGLAATDVTNYLHHARERLQGLITERVSEYVTSRVELVLEIEELFSG